MDVYSIIAYYAMADGSKARSLVKKIMSSAEKDLFTRREVDLRSASVLSRGRPMSR